MEGQEVGNSLDVLFRKMTPSSLEHFTAELNEQLPRVSPDTMGSIIDILFKKASSVRPEFSHVYIYCCRMLLELEVKTSSGESLKFKDLMQMRCQSHLIELLEKNKRQQNHQNQVLTREREMLLAFTTFIGELFSHDALSLETVQACLKALLAVKGDLTLLCVCRLLKDVGKFLDCDEGKVIVDEIFSNFYQMIRDKAVSAEAGFMLCSLCDLRENNWNSKGMQLTTFKKLREETPQGGVPAFQSASHTSSESAARASQEAAIKKGENTSQTRTPDSALEVPRGEVLNSTEKQGEDSKTTSQNYSEEKVKSETATPKFTYKKGQWSPMNPQGQKKYDRGFLLQFRPYCTTKPKGLPTGLPVLDHCRLVEENGHFNERQGLHGSGKESQSRDTFKVDESVATPSFTLSSQTRATSRPDKVEYIDDRKNSFGGKNRNGAKTNVSDQNCLPKNGDIGQHLRTERVQSLPGINGIVEEESHVDKNQDQAVSHRGRRVENGPRSLPASAGRSSHRNETKMNSYDQKSPNSSQNSSHLQSQCRSLPPCGMYNEQNGAKVTLGHGSPNDQEFSKKVKKGKETKQDNGTVAEEQKISSETSAAEGNKISSPEKEEPISLSEEEFEARAESIIDQYFKLNNSLAAKSCLKKLQTPHLQHIFIRLSIGKVIDNQGRSSEAVGRLFHELLSSDLVSEEQFCKGVNDYLAVTEEFAVFTPQYWSHLGEIIGGMVSGGRKSLSFLKEVIQTTPGDGKAAVFMAEILKACIEFTGKKNMYQVLRVWRASDFSWSLFIADTWNIKSFVEKQDLDFTLSPEERSARKTSKPFPQSAESNSATNQSPDENSRGQQTEKDCIPKFQNELLLLLKGNHIQHKAVFNIIENAISEDVRKSKDFIHALVLAVCLSSMTEGDDGPYTKCQRELLRRRSVLIQRYIRGNEDLEMTVLRVVEALFASLGNPAGVLRTMCEVLFDEDVISMETFNIWRDSEDFSEENEQATRKFFESLDQD